MPAERFYIQGSTLIIDEIFSLEKEEFHHLAHVMRGKVGDKVELINGLGSLAQAVVLSIEKHKAFLKIESVFQEKPPSYQLILAQALPRLPKLEFIIEKSVELGVTDLWLLPGILSEKKDFSENQIERIHHITLSALKQCGRLFIPNIIFKPSLLNWNSEEVPANSFFGDTEPNAPHFLNKLLSKASSPLLIVIGPEKGFHEKEALYMKDHLHMKGVKLHHNILRAETAAIHSVSLASSF